MANSNENDILIQSLIEKNDELNLKKKELENQIDDQNEKYPNSNKLTKFFKNFSNPDSKPIKIIEQMPGAVNSCFNIIEYLEKEIIKEIKEMKDGHELIVKYKDLVHEFGNYIIQTQNILSQSKSLFRNANKYVKSIKDSYSNILIPLNKNKVDNALKLLLEHLTKFQQDVECKINQNNDFNLKVKELDKLIKDQIAKNQYEKQFNFLPFCKELTQFGVLGGIIGSLAGLILVTFFPGVLLASIALGNLAGAILGLYQYFSRKKNSEQILKALDKLSKDLDFIREQQFLFYVSINKVFENCKISVTEAQAIRDDMDYHQDEIAENCQQFLDSTNKIIESADQILNIDLLKYWETKNLNLNIKSF